ncbi:MAG TPA: hypothetical protein PLX97_09570 [Gemmatales bacterium]|nr:hypothetical protein [Gemmatales bacterium]
MCIEKNAKYLPRNVEDWQQAAGGPSPEDEAMLKELLQQALASFEGDHLNMITLFMEGHSVGVVTQQAGFSCRMLQRVVNQFRDKLFALLKQVDRQEIQGS